jgi:hypothetical protein
MSPYEIELLLWYRARSLDHPDMSKNPPVWKPTIKSFFELGLMESDPTSNRCYSLTERGHFYVTDGLCNVPLPVNQWRIPPHTTGGLPK